MPAPAPDPIILAAYSLQIIMLEMGSMIRQTKSYKQIGRIVEFRGNQEESVYGNFQKDFLRNVLFVVSRKQRRM